MVILSDGTTIILSWVESTSSSFHGQTFQVHMVSGATISLTDSKDIEAFQTALKKFHKDHGVTDLTH